MYNVIRGFFVYPTFDADIEILKYYFFLALFIFEITQLDIFFKGEQI